ncbi:ABC transporter permease subunit [Streptomyces sp. NPDC058280]|uniref:ABC transporter permease subunit n=1 Tax=Streptomyces sp. NPDC058280 TaxID=3346419 RepID=UPI0036E6B489
MSALTLRGPVWVAVRQHRRALWAGLALLVLTIGVQAAARVRVNSTEVTGDCGSMWRKACETYSSVFGWFRWAETYGGATVFLLPLLVAAFVAGPLIARELESGTYKLAWTQSVSPARWLASKLAVSAAVTIMGTALLVITFRWTRSYVRTGWISPRNWGDGGYAALGPTAVAHVLLAVAVGALAGLLVRRTVVAMAVGVLATGAVMAVFDVVRPFLWPTVTASGGVRFPDDALLVQQGVILADGSRMTREECWDIGLSKSPCARPPGDAFFNDYHPASHFWPLQLMETGIVLALAAIVTAVAFQVLRRRHA